MNTPLSKKEKDLVTLLKKVETQSLWFNPIKTILQEGLNWKIRKLFAELKGQRADNPDAMRRVIGQEAAEKLENL